MRRRVVLPAPFGPSRPNTPGPARRSTPATAVADPKRRVRPGISTFIGLFWFIAYRLPGVFVSRRHTRAADPGWYHRGSRPRRRPGVIPRYDHEGGVGSRSRRPDLGT